MSLIAKNILPEKFWILEDRESNNNRGTIQIDKNKHVKIILDGHDFEFDSFDAACETLGIERLSKFIKKKEPNKEFSVFGYPTNTEPHNEMYDAQLKLPLYTKNSKSKSYFSAGYYIVKFDHGWAQSYCPKAISLRRNEFRGPFKTKIEMREQLRKYNGN